MTQVRQEDQTHDQVGVTAQCRQVLPRKEVEEVDLLVGAYNEKNTINQ